MTGKCKTKNISRSPYHRSRVDFLYYDGEEPYYEYYYTDSYVPRPSEPPPSWERRRPGRPERRRAGLSSSGSQSDSRVSQSKDGSSGGLMSQLLGVLPLLLLVPVIAGAAYYLLVLNGPTPVVKERLLSQGESSL